MGHEEYKDDVNMYTTNCDVASMVLLYILRRVQEILLFWRSRILFANDVVRLFIATQHLCGMCECRLMYKNFLAQIWSLLLNGYRCLIKFARIFHSRGVLEINTFNLKIF